MLKFPERFKKAQTRIKLPDDFGDMYRLYPSGPGYLETLFSSEFVRKSVEKVKTMTRTLLS